MSNLNKLIKQLAVDAMHALSPMERVFGTVVSDKPLKVRLDNGIELSGRMLELTNAVRDYDVRVKLITDIGTPPIEEEIPGDAEWHRVYNRLEIGDKVMMLKSEEGQKYIILDKVVEVDDT